MWCQWCRYTRPTGLCLSLMLGQWSLVLEDGARGFACLTCGQPKVRGRYCSPPNPHAPVLVCELLDGLHSGGWAKPKPGARGSILILHVAAFPDALAGRQIRKQSF